MQRSGAQAPDDPLDTQRADRETDSARNVPLSEREVTESVTDDPAWGSPRQPLSLEQARVAAVLGNLDLNVVKYDPEIAEEQVLQEAWRFESTFQGNVRRTNLDAPAPLFYDPLQPPIPSLFGGPPPQNTTFFGPGINVPLTTGGSVTLSEEFTRRSVDLPEPVPNVYDLAPTLSLSQPLLRNAGVAVNTAALQNAELQLGRVDAQTKLTAIRVLAGVEQAYWLLYGAQKNLEIAEQQVELAAEQTRIARRLEEAGTVSNVDVLRSLSGMRLREQFVVTARLRVQLTNRQLKQIMQSPDLPVDNSAQVVATSAPNLVGLTLDREALTSKAVGNRLELIDLALQQQQNQVAVNVAQNQSLPKIDLVFQGRLLGLGTSLGDSSDRAFGGDSTEFFAGLGFSQGLALNQAARANHRQACLQMAKTVAQQQQTRAEIVRQVHDAVDQFEQNWQRILVAQQAVTAARSTFDAETRLFELGQRTSDLVLIAASNLATAQEQLVQAVVDYQVSRIQIAVATGTVLGYAQLVPREAIPVPLEAERSDPDNTELVPPAP